MIGLPSPVLAMLKRHPGEQTAERRRAANLWTEGGWVFSTETGGPLNPRTDYDAWRQFLEDAGLRDARLRDARHTAATVLLLLSVPDRAVMGIMGWSKADMMAPVPAPHAGGPPGHRRSARRAALGAAR